MSCHTFPCSVGRLTFSDSYVPFSLLHRKGDQFRFSGSPATKLSDDPNLEGQIEAGYHEQILFDGDCRRILPERQLRSLNTVTQCEELCPDYNSKIILDFLRMSVSDEDWLFYSQIVADHAVTPTIATADGVRTALIQHLFSGRCVHGQGSACKNLVVGEKWDLSAGIKIIDFALEWVDTGVLTKCALLRIARALDLIPASTRQKRSVLSKMADRRRQLVNALSGF